MAGKIFINYRRGDDPGFTHALYQRLEDEFAAGDLFMDVEGHIKPGDDFVEVLNSQVAACDVLLAVIGPRWTDLMAARQGEADDFVAIEIKAALDRGKRVIPVLVGGAGMPRADALPAAIRPLARRNAMGLRPERFKTDCQGLVAALGDHLAAAERERAARTEAERAAAEAERQKREAEEAARVAAAEERARSQAAAGLSAEEIRKAEELANWDFVKDRNDIQDLRDHLARFPGGTTERYALARLDGLVWAALGPTPGVEQLRDYLEEFPKGAYAETAQVRVAKLERWAGEARVAKVPERAPAAAQPFHWAPAIAGFGLLVLGAGLAYLWQAPIPKVPEPPSLVRPKEPQPPTVFPPAKQATDDPALSIKPGSGQSFRDRSVDGQPCPMCPEMVVPPVGEFIMGSNEHDSEKPAYKVTIQRPFAVGKFEVTFAEWDACVAAGGCNHTPGDQGWGRGRRPVINVSWNDAKQYVAWLSRKTGKTYRLLSEAEWEYAARAGTTTKYAFGDTITSQQAQFSEGAWGSAKQTVGVGKFPPNGWGLYDMHGNVWEWCEDNWHADYKGAPQDGSVWQGGDVSLRVLRGGSWFNIPQFLRSANRNGDPPADRDWRVGFRLARTL